MRKNEALWLEHKSFFKKLQISRYLRSTVEALAATYIQKAYRGYSTRMRRQNLIDCCLFRKQLRSEIRDYIIANSECKGVGLILTQGEHRKRFKKWQYLAACTIQRTYRCFFSKNRVQKLRIQMVVTKRLNAVIRIQSFGRFIFAVKRVTAVRLLRIESRRTKGAILLQSAFRCMKARRKIARRKYKLRWLAARMIQCSYRFYRVNALLKLMRQRVVSVKLHNAALVLQCMARRKIACDRVSRISTARLHVRVSTYASRIQARIRGVLARVEVNKLKIKLKLKIQQELEIKTKQFKTNSNNDFINTISVHDKNNNLSFRRSFLEESNDLSISRHQGSIRGISASNFVTNKSNNNSEIALISAISQHDISTIKQILSNLLPVQSQSPIQSLSLSLPSSLPLLLSIDKDIATNCLISCINSFSFSSVQTGMEIMKLLFSAGFSVFINEIHKESGMTVLQLSAQLGYIELVQYLLCNGADVSVTDTIGNTALHRACSPTIRGAPALKMAQLLLGTSTNTIFVVILFISSYHFSSCITAIYSVHKYIMLCNIRMFDSSIDTCVLHTYINDRLSN